MYIKRWGANRNSGWTGLVDGKEASIKWDKKEENITLTVKRITDRNGNGQYNYEVDISAEEIVKIFDVLAKDGVRESSAHISEKLSESTRSLLRLLLVSDGLPGAP